MAGHPASRTVKSKCDRDEWSQEKWGRAHEVGVLARSRADRLYVCGLCLLVARAHGLAFPAGAAWFLDAVGIDCGGGAQRAADSGDKAAEPDGPGLSGRPLPDHRGF